MLPAPRPPHPELVDGSGDQRHQAIHCNSGTAITRSASDHGRHRRSTHADGTIKSSLRDPRSDTDSARFTVEPGYDRWDGAPKRHSSAHPPANVRRLPSMPAHWRGRGFARPLRHSTRDASPSRPASRPGTTPGLPLTVRVRYAKVAQRVRAQHRIEPVLSFKIARMMQASGHTFHYYDATP
jgi:hypothetical protein